MAITTPQNTTQTVQVKADGGATFVQTANTINNYIGTNAPASATSKQQNPAISTTPSPLRISSADILPAADPAEVTKIRESGKFDLNGTLGVTLVKIEEEVRRAEKLAAAQKAAEAAKPKPTTTPTESAKPKDDGKSPTTSGKPAGEPIVIHSVPPVIGEVKLDSFSKQEKIQLARILRIDETQNPDFDKTLKATLEQKKLLKDGNVNSVELVKLSQSRWTGTEGKALDSLGEQDKKYIQAMLGVADDGVIGPKTLAAAKDAGILRADGTINADNLLKINQNKLVADDGKYLTGVINENAKETTKATPESQKTSAEPAKAGGLGNLVADATKGLASAGVSITNDTNQVATEANAKQTQPQVKGK